MAYEDDGVVDKLSKLESLRSSGALTTDEFEKLKRRVIEGESLHNNSGNAKSRPFGVYVIFVLSVIATPWGMLYGALEAAGLIQGSDLGREYLQHLKPLTFLNQSGIIFTEISGICLFQLRRIAIPVFLAAVTTSWADVAWNIIENNLLSYAPGSVIVGVILDVVILIYMAHLSSDGTLN